MFLLGFLLSAYVLLVRVASHGSDPRGVKGGQGRLDTVIQPYKSTTREPASSLGFLLHVSHWGWCLVLLIRRVGLIPWLCVSHEGSIFTVRAD